MDELPACLGKPPEGYAWRKTNWEIRVVQTRVVKWHRNKHSGHEWPEHILKKRWEVIGPTGLLDLASTEAAAEKKADEWREFYAKNPCCTYTIERSQPKELPKWAEK